MKKACASAFTAVIIALLLQCPALARDKLHFSASVGMPFTNPENTGFEDRLVKELFGRLGYDVEVQFVPAERALRNLDAGIDDGAIGRTAGILTQYKNIRQVPEKALDRDFIIFAKSLDFRPEGWDSLAPYNVGIITGWKILENNIGHCKSLVKAKDGAQLFRLLEAGRVDLIIYNRWGGLQLLNDLELQGIRALEPPLVRAPHFFNLHKKHDHLVAPAARVLREMKEDGTYERIFAETLAPLAR